MPLPTAEMIERAARASVLQFVGESYVGLWESQSREERQEWTDQARAALSAAIPAVLEKAELAVYRALASNPVHAELAATAIRSLITATEGNNINELSQKSGQLVTASKESDNG